MKNLMIDEKGITDQAHILECVRELYETLFKRHEQKTATEIKTIHRHINIPNLSENKPKLGQEDLTEKDYTIL